MSETDLVRAGVELLLVLGVPAWRNNTGAYRKGKHYIQYGRVGSGDILGLLPPNGRFLSIECKVGRNKPTDKQIEFMDAINAAGGLAFVARSLEDIEEAIASDGA